MNINEIEKHWDGVSEGHRKLRFEDAKEQMLFLLNECRRLHGVEADNKTLKSELKNKELALKNRLMSFTYDIQKLIEKHEF